MLTRFATPLLVASAARAVADLHLPIGWRVLNECAIDTDSRVITGFEMTRTTDNTPASCIATCNAQGYRYAGVEDGLECVCGKGVDPYLESVPASDCDVPCSGDPTQKCGASWRITLYTTDSEHAAPIVLPPGWVTVASCAVDMADRLLRDSQANSLPDNTPDNCASHCASQGFAFAAVENGHECHCGSNLSKLITPRPVSDCYMQCPGDPSLECGGPWAAQVFSDPSLIRSETSSSETPTSTSIASLPTANPDDHLGLPPAWRTAYACAQDGPARILANVNVLRDNTPSRCSMLCEAKGFSVAGVEYMGECSCGDEFEWEPELRPSSECNMRCPGDHSKTCGSGWRVQLYTRNHALVPAVTEMTELPQQTETAASSSSSISSEPESTVIIP